MLRITALINELTYERDTYYLAQDTAGRDEIAKIELWRGYNPAKVKRWTGGETTYKVTMGDGEIVMFAGKSMTAIWEDDGS